MPERSRRPRDPSQLAKHVIEIATGERNDEMSVGNKNPAAMALGRLGGLKGGKARAKKLSPRKRKQIATEAARARWGKKND